MTCQSRSTFSFQLVAIEYIRGEGIGIAHLLCLCPIVLDKFKAPKVPLNCVYYSPAQGAAAITVFNRCML